MTTTATPRRWTTDAILAAGHEWKDHTGEFPAQHHWNPELAAVSIAWMDELDGDQEQAA